MSTTKAVKGSPGLVTSPNKLAEGIPAGGLEDCDNVVIQERGLIQARRGIASLGDIVSGTRTLASIHALPWNGFQFLLEVLDSNPSNANKLAVWNGAAVFDIVDADKREGAETMHSAQIGEATYITTNQGVYNSFYNAATDTIQTRLAGLPRPVITFTALTTSPTFTAGQRVAYRVVFGSRLPDGRLQLSEPSARAIFTSTGNFSVQLNASVLRPISSATDFFQLYRTLPSDGGDDPGDEMRLVAEISALESSPQGYNVVHFSSTFTDLLPVGLEGAALYTNATQEGLAQSNNPPPRARLVATHQGMTFLADIDEPQALKLQLADISSLPDTFFSPAGGGAVDIQDGSPIMTFTAPVTTAGIVPGMVITAQLFGPFLAVPAGTTVVSVDSATQLTMSANATAFITYDDVNPRLRIDPTITVDGVEIPFPKVTSFPTLSQNLAATVQDLARSINSTFRNDASFPAGPARVQAEQLNSPQDPPGGILLRASRPDAASFTVTSPMAGVRAGFNPALPLSSLGERKRNRIAISKLGVPDAFPLLNTLDIGGNDTVIGMGSIDAALIVVKRFGAFRVTGFTPETLQVSIIDSVLRCDYERSVAVLRAALYALSDRGVVAITNAGVQTLSEAINDDVRRAYETGGYGEGIHAVTDDEEGLYYLSAGVPRQRATVTYCKGFAGTTRYLAPESNWFEWFQQDDEPVAFGCVVRRLTANTTSIQGVFRSEQFQAGIEARYQLVGGDPWHRYLTAVEQGPNSPNYQTLSLFSEYEDFNGNFDADGSTLAWRAVTRAQWPGLGAVENHVDNRRSLYFQNPNGLGAGPLRAEFAAMRAVIGNLGDGNFPASDLGIASVWVARGVQWTSELQEQFYRALRRGERVYPAQATSAWTFEGVSEVPEVLHDVFGRGPSFEAAGNNIAALEIVSEDAAFLEPLGPTNWVFSVDTGAWTKAGEQRSSYARSTAHIYAVEGQTLYRDRRGNGITDFADRGVNIDLADITDTTARWAPESSFTPSGLHVQLPDTVVIPASFEPPRAGGVFVLNGVTALITSVYRNLLDYVPLSAKTQLPASGTAVLWYPIPTNVEYIPHANESPALQKHYQELSFAFQSGRLAGGFVGSSSTYAKDAEVHVTTDRPGDEEIALRTYVPRSTSLGHYLAPRFAANVAHGKLELQGVSITYAPSRSTRDRGRRG